MSGVLKLRGLMEGDKNGIMLHLSTKHGKQNAMRLGEWVDRHMMDISLLVLAAQSPRAGQRVRGRRIGKVCEE